MRRLVSRTSGHYTARGRHRLSKRESTRLSTTASCVPTTAQRILDVGGGRGDLLRLLSRRPSSSLLVVADADRTRLSTVAPGYRVVCDIQHLPFRRKSFDVVVSTEVFEHLPPDAERRAAREIADVAKDTLVVSVPNREELERSQVRCSDCGHVYHPHGHLRSYCKSSVRKLFADLTVSLCITEIGPRRLRLPSRLIVAARRRGLLRIPRVGENCPACGANKPAPPMSRSHRGQCSLRYRRPWILAVGSIKPSVERSNSARS